MESSRASLGTGPAELSVTIKCPRHFCYLLERLLHPVLNEHVLRMLLSGSSAEPDHHEMFLSAHILPSTPGAAPSAQGLESSAQSVWEDLTAQE